MAPPIEEHHVQRALCIWLDGNPDRDGNPRTTPALLPGVVYWHTPNSGEGRDAQQGMRLKQQGVKAGVHDLLFLWGGLYGLELKRPGGNKSAEDKRSPSQKAMHPRLLAAGMVASATCDSLETARETLRRWGLVVPGL
jgi:hypothetical protein